MKKRSDSDNLKNQENKRLRPWQQKLHTVIFEADTPAGKIFDVGLLIFILLSVAAIMLESVASVKAKY